MRTVIPMLLGSLLAATGAAIADSSPNPAAQSNALAPGYGALNFPAPEVGTYRLPPIGTGPSGQVLKDDGQVADLYSLFDNKVVLLSFIYSSCSDVNGCPLAAAVMNVVRQRLNKDPALGGKVKLVSLSFDPKHDTPEVMRLYGANFKGKGAVDWDFITTSGDDQLKPLLKGYSQTIVRDRDKDGNEVGSISHVLRVFLLDRQHRIRNIYSAGFLHPDILINDIKTIMASNDTPAAGDRAMAASQPAPEAAKAAASAESATTPAQAATPSAPTAAPVPAAAPAAATPSAPAQVSAQPGASSASSAVPVAAKPASGAAPAASAPPAAPISAAAQATGTAAAAATQPTGADVLAKSAASSPAAPQPGQQGVAILAQELRAGDYKGGYDTSDYVTRSVSLTDRVGKPLDFMPLAAHPPLGLPPLPVPATNPLTEDKISLGRKLFFDRRLSLNDTISCAMCHVPEQGFANHELETAVGIEGRTVRRNAPTLMNVGYFKRLFHDARENALENQVWQPFLAHNEMANPSIGMVIAKLEKLPDYQGLFEKAFGAGPDQSNIGMALASYERVLLAANSPFDRWHYGKDEKAVSDPVKRGFALFSGKAGCTSCHLVGPQSALFTDDVTHNTGVGYYDSMLREPPTRRVQLAPGVFVDTPTSIINEVGETKPNDLGLYEITQNPFDRWKYRTPSLRNVALTAPYMHNGSLKTLKDVVEFYSRGGVPNEVLDPLIKPLGLTDAEMNDIVSFLESLSGSNVSELVLDAFAAPIGDMRKQDPNWTHDNRIEY